MPVVYSFSAKSIQDYIFHSNQLKDMVAASEQIEQLCKPVLEGVLKALGLESKKPKFIRRAGGAFIIVLDDPADAKKLRDVWSFVVRRRFPGLLFNQFIKKYSQAADVLKDRNPPAVYSGLCPVFPIAGPLVARTPRLGEAAVEEIELKEDEGTERLDIATRQKREFLAQIDKKSGSLLEGKFFLKMDKSHKVAWPRHLDKRRGEHVEPRHLFPLLGENRYVGVVHADGNGFGVMMGKVKNTGSIEIYRAVSDSIAKIAERAARKATKDTLTEAAMDAKAGDFFVMPARPLILGGEDLTIIVRADLAIAFTKIYLEEFEQASEDILAALKEKYKQLALELPEILTACAGIAFIKASQPFHQACKLAESLCETAKRFSKDRKDQAENIPSSLAFHRITTSMIDEYPEIRRRELRIAVAIAGNQNSE
ncbi:MAG: hypothetical protein GY862_36720, partial [Gammaproteobacteria bacterium]|nr:hypothetical protein [Gammaproteobacteria bacterium]